MSADNKPSSSLLSSSSCSSPFPSLSTPRSTTPSQTSHSHLFLKKTLFELSQSGLKISDNLSSLMSDENSDNYNLTPQTFECSTIKSHSISNSTERFEDFTPGAVKNLSSEDTVEISRKPNAVDRGSFVLNYDDSFSAPGSAEIAERDIVLEVVSEDQPEIGSPVINCDQSQTDNQSEEVEELSEEEKLRQLREKEERESQELIWELMRQEQMELYQMQMQFMQSEANLEGLSEEDMRAIQETMHENNRVIQTIQTYEAHAEEAEEGEQGDEEGEEEDGEEEEEEWDYERLLALGQALGDVKTERWRARSKQVIESLPTMTYQLILERLQTDDHQQKRLKTSESSSVVGSPLPAPSAATCNTTTFFQDYRCVVCMEDFQASEVCRVLPCTHYFHVDCTAGWLSDHNNCPTCKKKVTTSPEK